MTLKAKFLFAIFVSATVGKSLRKDDVRFNCESKNLGNFSSAAVTIDGEPCASIAGDVLRRGGSAVDAAISGLFCNGVFVCHSMGIGGGLIMTVYQKSSGNVETLIARERAPLAATEDMFHGNPEMSQLGGLSIAVPGQVLGLFEAKERYGNPDISWSSLIEPTIEMCKNGIKVSKDLADALADKKQYLEKSAAMSDIFFDPSTNDVWKEGDIFKWPNLAKTLQRIADHGAKEFYSGDLAEDLVADLEDIGSIITAEDLAQYRTIWQPSIQVSLDNNLVFHSVQPPSSGAILAFILNIVKQYKLNPEDLNPLFYHRATEAFKWAYAQRTKLADPSDPDVTDFVQQVVKNITSEAYAFDIFSKISDNSTVNDPEYYGADFYNPDDHGTTHMSVVAPNGDAVAVTSTINLVMGSCEMGSRTGIIFNDEMDDFSSPNVTSHFGVPPSPINFIRPGKIPLSSTCPTIIVDSSTGDVRLVTGASGGTKITTQTAATTIRNLWLGQDIQEAIDAPRFHHQLMPMTVNLEQGVSQEIQRELISKGHNITFAGSLAVVNAISRTNGRIFAYSDSRKGGGVDGF